MYFEYFLLIYQVDAKWTAEKVIFSFVLLKYKARTVNDFS